MFLFTDISKVRWPVLPSEHGLRKGKLVDPQFKDFIEKNSSFST